MHLPCWWGCVARFAFPSSASEWAIVRMPTAEKGCVKNHSRKEQQQECIRNVCWWAVHGRHRGQQASCYSQVSVLDTSTGKCEQNVRELVSFLSHTQRHSLCAFVSQVGILLTVSMTWSILQCASFMSGRGEKGVRTHNRIQKHHICFPPLLGYSHEAGELQPTYPAPRWIL